MKAVLDNAKAPGRVYQRLKQDLEARAFSPGDRLPTLRKLARRFDVSLGAVHAAISRLRDDQLVVSRHGSGVYAADPSLRTRQVLLINRAAGHVWADLTQAFTDRFSSEVNCRLIVESVPQDQPDQLPVFRRKLRTLFDSGIDSVLFNASHDFGLMHVADEIRRQEHRLCFFSQFGTPAGLIPGLVTGGVLTDWYHGAYAAASHLVNVGCRRIVQVVSHPHITGEIEELQRGARAAITDASAGVKLAVHSIHMPPPAYAHQVSELLRAHPKVDGILTHGDHVAVPIITGLQQSGRRVPDDVAVVGYYDTPWTQSVMPELSSVSVRPREIANATVDMLMTGRFNEVKTIHPKLVVRGSSQRNGRTG